VSNVRKESTRWPKFAATDGCPSVWIDDEPMTA